MMRRGCELLSAYATCADGLLTWVSQTISKFPNYRIDNRVAQKRFKTISSDFKFWKNRFSVSDNRFILWTNFQKMVIFYKNRFLDFEKKNSFLHKNLNFLKPKTDFVQPYSIALKTAFNSPQKTSLFQRMRGQCSPSHCSWLDGHSNVRVWTARKFPFSPFWFKK